MTIIYDETVGMHLAADDVRFEVCIPLPMFGAVTSLPCYDIARCS